jgi:hypothetical protein
MLPAADAIEWTDSASTMHLVERIVPDSLAGKPVASLNISANVRLVGLVRGGQGRVDVEGLFAQESDILEFLVTTDGLGELHALLGASN